jgi:hypothetical protein
VAAPAIETTPGLAITFRTALFLATGYASATPHSKCDVSPDGKSFVMVGYHQASRVAIIQNLPGLVRRLKGGAAGGEALMLVMSAFRNTAAWVLTLGCSAHSHGGYR